MTKEKTNSIQKTARIAGILYLVLSVLGGFGILYISSLVVPGDAATTASNLLASESTVRLSFVSDLMGQVVFIFLVLFLYKVLKPVNKDQATLMMVLALVGIPIAMINVVNKAAALHLLSGAEYLTAFGVDQLQAQMMLFLNMHDVGVSIASIFWGLWLIPLGYLIFKSGYIPKILGILLIIGGLGYMIDFFMFFLAPELGIEIGQFTFVGELLLPLWLLIKGVNVEEWEKRVER